MCDGRCDGVSFDERGSERCVTKDVTLCMRYTGLDGVCSSKTAVLLQQRVCVPSAALKDAPSLANTVDTGVVIKGVSMKVSAALERMRTGGRTATAAPSTYDALAHALTH